MKTNLFTFVVPVVLGLAVSPLPVSAQVNASPPAPGLKSAAPPKLPRLPAGVTELKFGDFFVSPVGPRGLELTDKLRQLDGQRVRILGYMVRQEEPAPGCFLLAPVPVQVHEHDNGLSDDLPASTVLVLSPSHSEQVVPYTGQLLLLTGKLEIGNRAERDGRISAVRLTIDRIPRASPGRSIPSGKGAERLMVRRDSIANAHAP